LCVAYPTARFRLLSNSRTVQERPNQRPQALLAIVVPTGTTATATSVAAATHLEAAEWRGALQLFRDAIRPAPLFGEGCFEPDDAWPKAWYAIASAAGSNVQQQQQKSTGSDVHQPSAFASAKAALRDRQNQDYYSGERGPPTEDDQEQERNEEMVRDRSE